MAEVHLHPAGPPSNGTAEPVPTISEAQPGSIIARLRAQAKAQVASKQTDLKVGGEFQSLYIRYRPLGTGEMDKFVAARQGLKVQDISATAATMDMMARACIGVVGKYGGEEEILADADGPVRLEDRLARLLDLRSPDEPLLTSHDVIARLFGNNGVMIAHHGDTLAEWMQDPSTRDETPVGED